MFFSHLFFANDLVLFTRANLENCLSIKDVLNEFCTRSGQTISAAKSHVYFSPNVDPDQREAFSNILGFTLTSNLGKYLGFPLKHPGNRRHDFSFVLDRVKKKLSGCKANLLSMAGRMVLIQSSSATILAYVMQSNLLPSKILDGIDRVNRNFFGGLWIKLGEGTGLSGIKSPSLKILGGWGCNSERKKHCPPGQAQLEIALRR